MGVAVGVGVGLGVGVAVGVGVGVGLGAGVGVGVGVGDAATVMLSEDEKRNPGNPTRELRWHASCRQRQDSAERRVRTWAFFTESIYMIIEVTG